MDSGAELKYNRVQLDNIMTPFSHPYIVKFNFLIWEFIETTFFWHAFHN